MTPCILVHPPRFNSFCCSWACCQKRLGCAAQDPIAPPTDQQQTKRRRQGTRKQAAPAAVVARRPQLWLQPSSRPAGQPADGLAEQPGHQHGKHAAGSSLPAEQQSRAATQRHAPAGRPVLPGSCQAGAGQADPVSGSGRQAPWPAADEDWLEEAPPRRQALPEAPLSRQQASPPSARDQGAASTTRSPRVAAASLLQTQESCCPAAELEVIAAGDDALSGGAAHRLAQEDSGLSKIESDQAATAPEDTAGSPDRAAALQAPAPGCVPETPASARDSAEQHSSSKQAEAAQHQSAAEPKLPAAANCQQAAEPLGGWQLPGPRCQR